MRQWEADAQRVAEFTKRLQGCELFEEFDEPELKALADEDLAALETDVRVFEEDTPLARSFFKGKPSTPSDLRPVEDMDPKAYRKQRVAWRLGRGDLEHPKVWLAEEGVDTLLGILDRLAQYEKMTWEEVHMASRHNHEWESIDEWQPESRKRLEALELDDQSGWYQLHLDKRGRLFGYRQDNVFHVVWWDRDHEVYKTKGSR